MSDAPTLERYPDRELDVRLDRADVCPEPGCGRERVELPIPDQFYCRRCGKASTGPNAETVPLAEPPAPALFSVSALGASGEPPIDEGMAWVGEEGPDE